MTAAIVPIGANHNSADYLEIVYQRRRGRWEAEPGFWLQRTCPCHRGEVLTIRPLESRAKAEALKRILLAATMLGTGR
jgi:hypothetical protein